MAPIDRRSPLPNFVIAGAAKSGTTFIANALNEHPDIYLPKEKDHGYFTFQNQERPRWTGPGDEKVNNGAITDFDRYRELFRRAGKYRVVGEANWFYLAFPSSFARIRATLGNEVKIILVLRNPVDRAFSNYSALRRGGHEQLGFRAALDAEAERIAAGWSPFWAFRGLGLYSKQVEAAFAEFGRDKVGVWLYDDLENQPVAVLREMCRFLGVGTEGFHPATDIRYNASGMPRSAVINWLTYGHHPVPLRFLLPIPRLRERIRARVANANLRRIPLDPQLRAELAEEFRGEVQALARLLDMDLQRWLRS